MNGTWPLKWKARPESFDNLALKYFTWISGSQGPAHGPAALESRAPVQTRRIPSSSHGAQQPAFLVLSTEVLPDVPLTIKERVSCLISLVPSALNYYTSVMTLGDFLWAVFLFGPYIYISTNKYRQTHIFYLVRLS